jgi:hypothetical protein
MAVSEDSVRLVEDLERVQATAGELFPVPREWTVEDQREARRAVQLLDGQRVRIGDGPVYLGTDNPQSVVEAVGSSKMFLLRISPRSPTGLT